MRFILTALCAFMISSPAFSGGMSGGTGIGGLFEEIAEEIQTILKLPKLQIDHDTFRRIIMRLAVFGEAEIKIGNKTIVIKCKYGRLVDRDETLEILVTSED